MTKPQDIIEKISEKYLNQEGGFKHAIGRLEQVIEYSDVTLGNLREYAIAEAEECKRRAEYHNQLAVSRFYNEKVAKSLLDEATVMENVVELTQT